MATHKSEIESSVAASNPESVSVKLDKAIEGFNQQINAAFGGQDFDYLYVTFSNPRPKSYEGSLEEYRATQPISFAIENPLSLSSKDYVRITDERIDSRLIFGHFAEEESTPKLSQPRIELTKYMHYFKGPEITEGLDTIPKAQTFVNDALKKPSQPKLEFSERALKDRQYDSEHQAIRKIVERVFLGLGGYRFRFICGSKNNLFVDLSDDGQLSRWGFFERLIIQKREKSRGIFDENQNTRLAIAGLNAHIWPIEVAPYLYFREPGFESPRDNTTQDPDTIQRIYRFLDEVIPINKT